jgi:hypothetical protein
MGREARQALNSECGVVGRSAKSFGRLSAPIDQGREAQVAMAFPCASGLPPCRFPLRLPMVWQFGNNYEIVCRQNLA